MTGKRVPRGQRQPDPMCNHKAKGRVQAGDPTTEAHASTYVCDRQDCIDDAIEWAFAITHQMPEHVVGFDRPKGNADAVR